MEEEDEHSSLSVCALFLFLQTLTTAEQTQCNRNVMSCFFLFNLILLVLFIKCKTAFWFL